MVGELDVLVPVDLEDVAAGLVDGEAAGLFEERVLLLLLLLIRKEMVVGLRGERRNSFFSSEFLFSLSLSLSLISKKEKKKF